MLLLIDLLIPILIAASLYWGYRYYFTSPSPIYTLVAEHYDIPTKQYLSDWNYFLKQFSPNLTQETIRKLHKITEQLENLQVKFNYENLDGINRPKPIYLLADIIYKHVPEIILEYTKIPKNLVSKQNQPTPLEILNKNLDLLVQTTQNITVELFQENLHKMKVHTHHIENKFLDD